MPHPNAVLPCGTPSARRRHAALSQCCPKCEAATTATPDTAASYLRRAERRLATLDATNRQLRSENAAMASRLADVAVTFKALMRTQPLSRDLVSAEFRRIFPTSRKGAAA